MPNLSLLFYLSFVPFLFFLVLLFWKKTSLLLASAATTILLIFLLITFWKIFPLFIFTSLLKGFLVAFDILIIIFGAVFFLEILKQLKILEHLIYFLESLSKDYRVKVIFLAWFFESFIEGTAGFGTPAVIVAPLLIGLGLSPIKAVIISLLGNSTSVVFGAAGTPIRTGFSGLDTLGVPLYGVLLNCVGFLVPVFMLWTLVSDKKDKKAQFLEGLPFAVWSGIAFVVPSILFVFLGQEFPSILGSIAGLLLVLITTRLGIFVPKNLTKGVTPKFEKPVLKSLLPYGILIILLVMGKFLIGSRGTILDFGSYLRLKHTFNFFNPGFAFIAVGLITSFFWKTKKIFLFEIAQSSFKKTIEPFLVIVLMSTITQLMINSVNNQMGVPSVLEFMARDLETFTLPFLAPFIGAFGSFITGSATVSNIMFGNLLYSAAKAVDIFPGIILALTLVGAAAGNMVALADILAAETVVGLKNQERQVVKGVILPCLIYLVLVGVIGFVVISVGK